MFKCHVCGSEEAKEEQTNEIFQIDDQPVLVEHIPTIVCSRCGEKTFSRETTEQIRLLLHGDTKPVKAISIDVFDFFRIKPQVVQGKLELQA